MNVASLELCRELHALSGWEDVTIERSWWQVNDEEPIRASFVGNAGPSDRSVIRKLAPGYDLSYMMAELPRGTRLIKTKRGYSSYFILGTGARCTFEATNPEDAAAKLTIELFKQGVLVKDRTEPHDR